MEQIWHFQNPTLSVALIIVFQHNKIYVPLVGAQMGVIA